MPLDKCIFTQIFFTLYHLPYHFPISLFIYHKSSKFFSLTYHHNLNLIKTSLSILSIFPLSLPQTPLNLKNPNFLAPMAPSRKDKGKTQIDEGSSEHQESTQHASSLKSRRLTFDFWNRSLMPVKYGNLSSFPSHSFDFPELLRCQGVYSTVSDCGNYYPDLVKDFYANLVIVLSDKDVLTSRVKNTNIVMDLEVFGNCLGLPYKGQSFLHGFTLEWEGYSKMDYFFHNCRVSQQAILGKKNLASSRVLLFSKNLTVSDRMLHYLISYVLMPKHSSHSQIGDMVLQLMYAIKNKIAVNWAYTIMHRMKHQQSLTGGLPYARLISKILEACGIDLKREPKKKMTARECEINASTSIWNTGIFLDMDGTYKYKDESLTSSSDPQPPPPAPEGGYSNEALYNKICSVEMTMMKNYHEQKFEMASIKRLLGNLSKSPNPEISDEEEGEEEDDEDMGMSDSD